MELLDLLLDFSPWLLGPLGVGTLIVWFRKRLVGNFRRHLGRRVLCDSLIDALGDNAADAIIQATACVEHLQARHGEHHLRLGIAERHSSLGIYICDSGGLCTWANDWVRERWGVPDITGWGWLSAIPAGERERVHHRWLQSVQTGIPYTERYSVEPPNGMPGFHAEAESWPVTNEAGEVLLYVGKVTEVEPEQVDEEPGA